MDLTGLDASKIKLGVTIGSTTGTYGSVLPPANLSAVVNAGGTQIDISWDAVSGAPAAAKYLLLVNVNAPVSFIPDDGVNDYTASIKTGGEILYYDNSSTSFSHSNRVEPGKSYHYALYYYDGTVYSLTASTTFASTCDKLTGDWVSVPGDSDYGTFDFCVMKYEAKNVSSAATSVASDTPWVYISVTNAETQCQSIGAQLISNDQWDTIATNISNQASNWSDSSVGSGDLNTGHSDNSPSSPLAASTDSNACSGTGQTCDDVSWDSQKRTHTLSNGEVIWDIAGNVHEWTMPDGALRGGDWSVGSQAGVSAASQYIGSSGSEVSIGFRCVSTAP